MFGSNLPPDQSSQGVSSKSMPVSEASRRLRYRWTNLPWPNPWFVVACRGTSVMELPVQG